MFWLLLGITLVATYAGITLAVASVRVKRCPDCGASRLLKNGTSVAFCLDCGHWFDPRISA